ncbi:SAM-dependent methyltransferase, partial [Aerococcus sp. L_32]
NGQVAALVKPQFEAGKDKVGKKGIVRDKKVHRDVIEHTMQTAIGLGYDVTDLTYSPITGGTGNIEFLMLLTNTEGEPGQIDTAIDIDAVIEEAHSVFH